ncbi:hypothetical protein LAJ19_17590 (plasmid) [Deinococcus taeanensis]|uniref:hypothetical protein n=1 Tax=Deinococcus taeanensis TaxID=2737050 RepID=UPI001CDBF7A6|nr:hypothetical protein [Deinococcus taeanensis]UBV44585.1 hypothetical protein LAJ19_17590 [Deinococcus taeanensis]
MKHALALTLALMGMTLAAPNPANWTQVLKEARGQTVNFYMWGGSENINRYVDTAVAPALKKLGVTLARRPWMSLRFSAV